MTSRPEWYTDTAPRDEGPLVVDLHWYDDVFRPVDPVPPADRPAWMGVLKDDAAWPPPLEWPPLTDPTDAQLKDSLRAWAGMQTDPRAPGLLVRQYGAETLSGLSDEGRRYLYWHTETELREALLT